MKKSARIWAIIVLASILFTAFPLCSSAASPLDGKTILCFGDSLTQGTLWWVNNGYDVYADILQDNFSGSTVINGGIRGDSTWNALQRYKNDVIAKNPDIVIICFGMNDQAWEVQYNRPIQTLDKYVSQLTTMITDIKAIGADVILMTPNPVYEAAYTPTAYNNYEYGLMPQYCDAMRKLAIELDCGLIDMYREISARGVSAYVSSDGIHQSTAGHQLYASCITSHLKAVYENNGKAVADVKCVTQQGNLVKSFKIEGASGAYLTLPSPALKGHTALSAEQNITLSTGSIDITYKSDLEVALQQAEQAVANAYSPSAIEEVRKLSREGLSMLSPENKIYTAENMAQTAEKLSAALQATGENVLFKSSFAKYTTTAPNYYFQGNDTRYFDDGVRLTDGKKGNTSGENTGGYNYYSAWSGKVEIVVDLGEKSAVNVYKAYVADSSSWGITAPSAISVSCSDDGIDFSPVTVSTSRATTNTGSWNTYVITAESEDAEARYIKITISGGFVWIDEVEVGYLSAPLSDIVYIDGFNKSVGDSQCYIFDSSFGNLSNANLRYTANLVAELKGGEYVVKEVFEGNGSNVDRVLKENEILVACHYGTEREESGACYSTLLSATVGQVLSFSGADVDSQTAEVLSYMWLEDAKEIAPEYSEGDVNGDGSVDMFDYLLIKNIYFDSYTPTAEEAGRADLTSDGAIDMFDYLALKTIIFA